MSYGYMHKVDKMVTYSTNLTALANNTISILDDPTITKMTAGLWMYYSATGEESNYTLSNLTVISLPNCSQITGTNGLLVFGNAAFVGCNVKSVYLPKLESYMQSLRSYYTSRKMYNNTTYYFYNTLGGDPSKVETLYFENLSKMFFSHTGSRYYGMFVGFCNLRSVYLMMSYVLSIPNSEQAPALFRGTPIIDSTYVGGSCSIYVPASMLSEYVNHFQWSAVSSRFVGI